LRRLIDLERGEAVRFVVKGRRSSHLDNAIKYCEELIKVAPDGHDENMKIVYSRLLKDLRHAYDQTK
jgi:hypothetical protein